MMRWHKQGANCWVNSDFTDVESAAHLVTHLAIGAHQDDLEFMAFHGIAACYKQSNKWFAGITVTDGVGSSLGGEFSQLSPQELGAVRTIEQRQAAELGEYAYQLQLGYSSSEVKMENPVDLIKELTELLILTQPEVLYLHQPADKHPTHIAVLKASIAALKNLPAEMLPKKIYGCEGWRDLDWLCDEDKVALDVSDYPELAEQLMQVFASQIRSGKRYDLATLGRRRANATYANPHQLDVMQAVTWALDLKPLVVGKSLTMDSFIVEKIEKFKDEVLANI